jgi:hypothetical protein
VKIQRNCYEVSSSLLGLLNQEEEEYLCLCQFVICSPVLQPLITGQPIIRVVQIISLSKHTTMHIVGHLYLCLLSSADSKPHGRVCHSWLCLLPQCLHEILKVGLPSKAFTSISPI